VTFLDRHLRTRCWVKNRVVAPEPDRHGNTVYVFADPIATMCRLVERASPETGDGRSYEQTFLLLLGASMAGRIDAFAQVEVEGYGPLEVVGEPVIYESLTELGPHHVEATVSRSTA
jgi:hypothetical protein